MVKKRTPLTEIQLEDAARLRAIWDEKKRQAALAGMKLSQATLGADNQIGNQAAVWQYMNGRIALNIPAALGFAKGLGVEVSDFSPALARQIAEMAPASGEPSAPPNTTRYYLTPDEEKLLLQFREFGPPLQKEVLRSMGSIIDGTIVLAKKTLKGVLKHVPDARIEETFGLPGKKVRPQ